MIEPRERGQHLAANDASELSSRGLVKQEASRTRDELFMVNSRLHCRNKGSVGMDGALNGKGRGSWEERQGIILWSYAGPWSLVAHHGRGGESGSRAETRSVHSLNPDRFTPKKATQQILYLSPEHTDVVMWE